MNTLLFNLYKTAKTGTLKKKKGESFFSFFNVHCTSLCTTCCLSCKGEICQHKSLTCFWRLLLSLFLSQDQKTNIVELALFNISADPTERNDLSRRHPDIVRQLKARIHEYQKTAVPPGIVPDDIMALVFAVKNKAWVPWRNTCNARWIQCYFNRAFANSNYKNF